MAPLVLSLPLTKEQLQASDFIHAILCVRNDEDYTAATLDENMPYRLISGVDAAFDAQGKPFVQFLGVSLLINGEPLRVVETPKENGAIIEADDSFYFFRDKTEYNPNPDSYLLETSPMYVRSDIQIDICQQSEELSITGGYTDLVSHFPMNDVDCWRSNFIVDELSLYATEHKVYHFSSLLPDSDDIDYIEQTPHPIDEPVELSFVPLKNLEKKLYLIIEFGTKGSVHHLFIDPATGETLLSTP